MKVVKRPYRQGARAEGAQATRARILDVATALFWDNDFDAITLERIAAEAGVTPQTVLRRFGSKDGVFAVALEERADAVMDRRKPAAADPAAAVKAVVASYEEIGDANWRMLRFERQQPMLGAVLAKARALHRAWIEQSFALVLPERGAARERMIDALFTALDFYVWKLHRQDLGRARRETEGLMLGLVNAIINNRGAP